MFFAGLSNGWLLLPGRPTDSAQQGKVCILALLFTDLSPKDIRGACFLLSVVHYLTFLPPLAPRALTRFLATTEALSPSGHGSSGLPQTMNAVPSPDRDPPIHVAPTSDHSISTHPMHPNASGRIEFIIFLIMDWSFASGCSPPRLSTTQLPSATDSQCSVRRGLSPRCWCALSGARGELLAAPGRLQATQSCASSSAKAIRVEEGLFFYSGQGVILTPAAAKIGKGYVSSRSALRR